MKILLLTMLLAMAATATGDVIDEEVWANAQEVSKCYVQGGYMYCEDGTICALINGRWLC